MGDKKLLTPQELEKAQCLINIGFRRSEVARYFGCSAKTLFRYIKGRQPYTVNEFLHFFSTAYLKTDKYSLHHEYERHMEHYRMRTGKEAEDEHTDTEGKG